MHLQLSKLCLMVHQFPAEIFAVCDPWNNFIISIQKGTPGTTIYVPAWMFADFSIWCCITNGLPVQIHNCCHREQSDFENKVSRSFRNKRDHSPVVVRLPISPVHFAWYILSSHQKMRSISRKNAKGIHHRKNSLHNTTEWFIFTHIVGTNQTLCLDNIFLGRNTFDLPAEKSDLSPHRYVL